MDPGELVRLVQAGGDAADLAANRLFSELYPTVRACVRAQCSWFRGYEDFDDLIQQSLMRVLGGLKTFQYRAKEPFLRWVRKSVTHEIADRRRFHSAAVRLPPGEAKSILGSEGEPIDVHAPDCLRDAEHREQIDRVLSALHDLPEALRELMICVRLEDESVQGAARDRGVSEAVIRNQLKLAETLIRRRLARFDS